LIIRKQLPKRTIIISGITLLNTPRKTTKRQTIKLLVDLGGTKSKHTPTF